MQLFSTFTKIIQLQVFGLLRCTQVCRFKQGCSCLTNSFCVSFEYITCFGQHISNKVPKVNRVTFWEMFASTRRAIIHHLFFILSEMERNKHIYLSSSTSRDVQVKSLFFFSNCLAILRQQKPS